MVWKSIVMFYYSLKDFKRRFNCSHVTKVSPQTFARGYKKRIQLGKTLYRFPDFINKKYFTLILRTMFLTPLGNSVTGMEISTMQKQPAEGHFKIQIKVSQNSRENTYANVSFLIKLQGLGLQLC